ncbi:MAG: hypothetical protein JWM21_2128 [Acidobacteria bacterium]|nr:hypothetical protein [Acidobacteriota bacterium]
MREETHIRWRWGVLAMLAMIALSLYPHTHFRLSRGAEWNGSYAAIEGVGDEVAYSAYVNALMAGRPRRNDPYSGRDDTAGNQQPESLFSIQFVPAYLIAFTARAFGVSAATAFIVLTPLTAGAASLVLFWLLALATRDDGVAAAGTIVVLCLGTVAGGHGLPAGIVGGEPLYNYLMFLRRYQPAAAFPLFLLFFVIIWQTVTLKNRLAAAAFATGAGIVFGLLVYSYVYLWTGAAAWLACVFLLWVIARPPGWQGHLKTFGITGFVSLLTLIPLAGLYAHRAASLDAVQALELSHRPDLFRLPELISLAVLVLLAWLMRRKVVGGRDIRTLFAMSFALLPFVVFNQQMITGRSLQPLHYEMFVANYSALISLMLVLAMVVKTPAGSSVRMRRKAVLWLAIAAFEWGSYETVVATRRSMEFDRSLDDARVVSLRLETLANLGQRKREQPQSTILLTDLLAADGLPTSSSQAVLWAPHMLVFSGVTVSESKERFYQYLYYTGITPAQLRNILGNERQYGFTAGLFGFERTIKGLSLNPKPISAAELENELKQYADYCASFTLDCATRTELSYLVMPVAEERNLTNLDRWYERDGGEQVGHYRLYRLKLRAGEASVNVQMIRSSLR